MSFLDEYTKKMIGLDTVFDSLKLLSPYGRTLKKSIIPYKDEAKLKAELDSIETILCLIKSKAQVFFEIEKALGKVCDIKSSINRCLAGDTLDDIELYEIKCFSILSEHIRGNYIKLNAMLKELYSKDISDVVRLLDADGKGFETFHIYDEYSVKLEEIRITKINIEKELYGTKDIDLIATLKAKRLKLVHAEQKEELKVEQELSKKLIARSSDISNNMDFIGRIDLLIAKARLAEDENLSKPEISEILQMKNGINPVAKAFLEEKGLKFTPITMELSKGVTLITGANMGGKTISLGIVALNTYLAQMGFYVYAESFLFPFMDFVYYVSEDMSSFSDGLSTFGGEVLKVKEIIKETKKFKGLILIDEFARGTNPEEGSNLIKALIKYLNNTSSISLLTTHFDKVILCNIRHYQVRGLKDANLKDLEEKLSDKNYSAIEAIQSKMDYTLDEVTGITEVPKDALNICRMLGLDAQIINYAEEYYKK